MHGADRFAKETELGVFEELRSQGCGARWAGGLLGSLTAATWRWLQPESAAELRDPTRDGSDWKPQSTRQHERSEAQETERRERWRAGTVEAAAAEKGRVATMLKTQEQGRDAAAS